MSSITDLIDQQITDNQSQEITGPVLNGVLKAMVQDGDQKVSDLAQKGYKFGGLVGKTDYPINDANQKFFYIAKENGTYSLFGNNVAEKNKLTLFIQGGEKPNEEETWVEDKLSIANDVSAVNLGGNTWFVVNDGCIAEHNGVISKVRFKSPNGAKFYVCVLLHNNSGSYKIISRQLVNGEGGLAEVDVNLPIEVGQYIGIQGTGEEGELVPSWGARTTTNGWRWLSGSGGSAKVTDIGSSISTTALSNYTMAFGYEITPSVDQDTRQYADGVGGSTNGTTGMIIINYADVARIDGKITQVRFKATDANTKFYLIVATRDEDNTNKFTILKSQLISATSDGINTANVDLDIRKGQYWGVQATGDGEKVPKYGTFTGSVWGWQSGGYTHRTLQDGGSVVMNSLEYYKMCMGVLIEGETTPEWIKGVVDFSQDINTILSNIGNLANLTTTNKSNLVNAINELNQGGGNVDIDPILNPTTATNTKAAGAKTTAIALYGGQFAYGFTDFDSRDNWSMTTGEQGGSSGAYHSKTLNLPIGTKQIVATFPSTHASFGVLLYDADDHFIRSYTARPSIVISDLENVGIVRIQTFNDWPTTTLSFEIEGAKSREIITHTIVATRNSADFNSIREIMMSITDASEYNRYIIKVPKGRWFECDIKGKKWVSIVGESREETILYCDGLSDNIVPTNYPFPAEIGKKLSEVSKQNKHCIFVTEDLDISNVTIEVDNVKYCVHLDSSNSIWKAKMTNCHFVETNSNFCIGVGIRGGQSIEITNSIFENQGVFLHNWNNQTLPTKITIDGCRFKNVPAIATIDELGSNQEDIWHITNCYSDRGALTWMVDKTGETTFYTKADGTKETNPQNVPYCIKLNTMGTNVTNIRIDTSYFGVSARPNATDYMIYDLSKIQ